MLFPVLNGPGADARTKALPGSRFVGPVPIRGAVQAGRIGDVRRPGGLAGCGLRAVRARRLPELERADTAGRRPRWPWEVESPTEGPEKLFAEPFRRGRLSWWSKSCLRPSASTVVSPRSRTDECRRTFGVPLTEPSEGNRWLRACPACRRPVPPSRQGRSCVPPGVDNEAAGAGGAQEPLVAGERARRSICICCHVGAASRPRSGRPSTRNVNAAFTADVPISRIDCTVPNTLLACRDGPPNVSRCESPFRRKRVRGSSVPGRRLPPECGSVFG